MKANLPHPDEFLAAKELAMVLGVHLRTIRRMTALGFAMPGGRATLREALRWAVVNEYPRARLIPIMAQVVAHVPVREWPPLVPIKEAAGILGFSVRKMKYLRAVSRGAFVGPMIGGVAFVNIHEVRSWLVRNPAGCHLSAPRDH